MIWLLELELVSFLGKQTYLENASIPPKLKVVCLQSSGILERWSEPSNEGRKDGPPLLPFFPAPFLF